MNLTKRNLALLCAGLFSIASLSAVIPVEAVEPSDSTAAAPESSGQSDKLYLDFKAAPLINVLMVLSQLSGINFVAGKEVANREVNMVLDNVTIDDALDAIGRGSNVSYDYIPNRNLYLFRAAADKEDQAQLVTRIFKLYYIHASELREISGEGGGNSESTFGSLEETTESTAEVTSPILKIVESILSERGKVKVDDRSNSLVVVDTEDRVRMVEQAVQELDRPIDQVLIHVVLVETFEDLDRHLGIEWSDDTSEGTFGVITGGSQETRFPFNVNEYNALTRIFGKTSLNKGSIVEDADALTEGSKDFTDLSITFKAFQDAQKLRILAKPRILVLDNHPALVKITTNEAIGESTVSSAAGQLSSTSTTTERTETGTSLRVTPLINKNNRITMTIEPRFVTSTESATVADTRDPTIRTARTTLMVNSGQTVVVGGLLSSQQTNAERKVPFLGDIPYIGEAFTRRSTTIADRELILFITPIIVRNPSEVQAVSVPDKRDRFDDMTAPFWKWKRKNWYKELKEEAKAGEISTSQDMFIPAREQLMDEAMSTLSNGQEVETTPAQKNNVQNSKSISGRTAPAKPAASQTPSSLAHRSALVGVVS